MSLVLPPDPQRILEAARLETLGRLSLVLAHDFNNLLSVTLGWAELGAAQPSHTAESFREIRKAADRGMDLTRRIQALGRGGPDRPAAVDAAASLRDLEPLLRAIAGERVALRIALAPGPLRVRIDPARLDLVLLALALRACRRIGERGTLTFSTAVEAGRVRIDVTDDSSADPTGGLPFAAAELIARGAGGRMETLRDGIRLDLPEHAGGPVTPTILLAAGDATARSEARRSLEAEGWPVLEAGSGGDALARLERETGPVDVLVAHAYVPPPSGALLALRAKSLRPSLLVYRWGDGAGTEGIDGVLEAEAAGLGAALRSALG